MKKHLFVALTSLWVSIVAAQSNTYFITMAEKVAAVDTVRTADGWQKLAQSFERIGNVEKNQWLPFYYAAVAQVKAGTFLIGKAGTEVLDSHANKAEAFLNMAKKLRGRKDVELHVVEKMIATLRLVPGGPLRYMKYGAAGSKAMSAAKKLDPKNPRVHLLEAEEKLYTPAMFGGSKTEAKKLYEIAIARFDAFRPESNISPRWGKATAVHGLRLASK